MSVHADVRTLFKVTSVINAVAEPLQWQFSQKWSFMFWCGTQVKAGLFIRKKKTGLKDFYSRDREFKKERKALSASWHPVIGTDVTCFS